MENFIIFHGKKYEVKRRKGQADIVINGDVKLFISTYGPRLNWRIDSRGLWLDSWLNNPARSGSHLIVELGL